MQKVVLGIDASYSRSGLVWLAGKRPKVVANSTLTFPVGPKRHNRALSKIWGMLYDNHADLAIIEDAAYGSPNRMTVIKLKELSLCYKMVLDALEVPWLEVSPTLVRKWLTGKGNADKEAVVQELQRRWGIAFNDDLGQDLSDAALLAAWGLLEKCK